MTDQIEPGDADDYYIVLEEVKAFTKDQIRQILGKDVEVKECDFGLCYTVTYRGLRLGEVYMDDGNDWFADEEAIVAQIHGLLAELERLVVKGGGGDAI